MQGYANEDGSVGVDDLERWSLEVVNFISETTSATSVQELIEVCQRASSIFSLLIYVSSMTL